MKSYNIDKLNTIVKHFGRFHQIIKLGEEVGELNKAILNKENGYTVTNNEVTSELADVYILLKQVELMYDVDSKELQNVIDMKIDRVFDKYNVSYT